MKLIYCPLCGDVQTIPQRKWRTCHCGESGGQYNIDGNTATVGGKFTRVFGIANPFFENLWKYINEEAKALVRKDYKYGPGDIWWGEFPGDVQIFRIDNQKGPRLKVEVERLDQTTNRITLWNETREYSIDGKKNLSTVVVPYNMYNQLSKKQNKIVKKRNEQASKKKTTTSDKDEGKSKD